MTDLEVEERLATALMNIEQWCRAYPVEVFTPLSEADVKRAAELLEANGISCGALHAGWARHILSGICGIASAALRP